jgi:Trypsin
LTQLNGSDASDHIAVQAEHVHPNYAPGTEENDIMVIQLVRAVSAAAAATPVTIAASGPEVNEALTVIGFGKTETGPNSATLLRVNVSAVDFGACATQYLEQAGEVVVDNIMFCSGGQGTGGTCQGDSGGPLFVHDIDGTVVLKGIVSWGEGCGSGFPDISVRVARVAAYADWIRQGICCLSGDASAVDCSAVSPPTNAPNMMPSDTPSDVPSSVPTRGVDDNTDGPTHVSHPPTVSPTNSPNGTGPSNNASTVAPSPHPNPPSTSPSATTIRPTTGQLRLAQLHTSGTKEPAVQFPTQKHR